MSKHGYVVARTGSNGTRFWNPDSKSFVTELDGSFKTYMTRGVAEKVAQKIYREGGLETFVYHWAPRI